MPELLNLGVAGGLFGGRARSRVFLLAAYAAALVGLPAGTHPIGILDVAVARAGEINIGILALAAGQEVVRAGLERRPGRSSLLRRCQDAAREN